MEIENINDILTISTDADIISLSENDEEPIEFSKKSRSRAKQTRSKQFYRRFTSERALEETIDLKFNDGESYHVISMGDIDSLSFLKAVLRQQKLKYLLLSTWCMALQDVEKVHKLPYKELI